MKKNDQTSGEILRRARLQAGLSQQELADKIGVLQPYISAWETEKTTPNPDQLKKLRKVIDLEIDSETGPSAIGAWLMKIRSKRGVSVTELAEKSGLSLPTIYNIESGRSPNPHESTIRKLERALNDKVPTETAEEAKAEATIEGIGELLDFDPHEQDEWPNEPGVYVLYDVSDRPIYVGEGEAIKRRLTDHEQKFWFKRPIVEKGSYLVVRDRALRRQIEKVLIKFLKSNAVLNTQHVER